MMEGSQWAGLGRRPSKFTIQTTSICFNDRSLFRSTLLLILRSLVSVLGPVDTLCYGGGKGRLRPKRCMRRLLCFSVYSKFGFLRGRYQRGKDEFPRQDGRDEISLSECNYTSLIEIGMCGCNLPSVGALLNAVEHIGPLKNKIHLDGNIIFDSNSPLEDGWNDLENGEMCRIEKACKDAMYVWSMTATLLAPLHICDLNTESR